MATMPPTKKKAIALLTTAVGLGILLVAGVMLYRPLEERYWLWKLREGEESEKERAADRLAELGVEEAVRILLGLIPDEEDPDWRLLWENASEDLFKQQYAARALVKMGSVAVPQLRATLTDQSEIRRGFAAYILGEMGPTAEAAVPDLLEAVKRSRVGRVLRIVGLKALMKITPDVAETRFRVMDPQRRAKPGRDDGAKL